MIQKQQLELEAKQKAMQQQAATASRFRELFDKVIKDKASDKEMEEYEALKQKFPSTANKGGKRKGAKHPKSVEPAKKKRSGGDALTKVGSTIGKKKSTATTAKKTTKVATKKATNASKKSAKGKDGSQKVATGESPRKSAPSSCGKRQGTSTSKTPSPTKKGAGSMSAEKAGPTLVVDRDRSTFEEKEKSTDADSVSENSTDTEDDDSIESSEQAVRVLQHHCKYGKNKMSKLMVNVLCKDGNKWSVPLGGVKVDFPKLVEEHIQKAFKKRPTAKAWCIPPKDTVEKNERIVTLLDVVLDETKLKSHAQCLVMWDNGHKQKVDFATFDERKWEDKPGKDREPGLWDDYLWKNNLAERNGMIVELGAGTNGGVEEEEEGSEGGSLVADVMSGRGKIAEKTSMEKHATPERTGLPPGLDPAIYRERAERLGLVGNAASVTPGEAA